MKEYYFSESNEQFGPFNLDELKKQEINNETLIWHKGMEEWKRASEIEELSDLFNSAPPPFKKSVEQTNESFIFKYRKVFFALNVALIIGLIYLAFSNKSEKIELSEEELKKELQIKEIQQPLKHLSMTYNLNDDYYSRIDKIFGDISNNASVTTFKDIVLIVTYFSKSDTELGTEEFTIFEYIKQGEKINFKVEPTVPKETKKIEVNIKSAIPV